MFAVGHDDGMIMFVGPDVSETQTIRAHPVEECSEFQKVMVAMSPNGAFVVSVTDIDAGWKLWDVETGQLIKTGDSHDGTGRCRCTWSVVTGLMQCPECPVNAHVKGTRYFTVNTVDFSPSGKIFATGSKEVYISLGCSDWVCAPGASARIANVLVFLGWSEFGNWAMG